MQTFITVRAIKAMNFAVGFALCSMLFPHFGKPCGKPAGVRTAIELLDKRAPKLNTLATLALA